MTICHLKNGVRDQDVPYELRVEGGNTGKTQGC